MAHGLIVYLGTYPHGRQFVINVAAMTKATLEQVTAPAMTTP